MMIDILKIFMIVIFYELIALLVGWYGYALFSPMAKRLYKKVNSIGEEWASKPITIKPIDIRGVIDNAKRKIKKSR